MESLKVRIEKMVLEYQHKIDDQDKLLRIQQREARKDSVSIFCVQAGRQLHTTRQVYVQAQKDIESFLDYTE